MNFTPGFFGEYVGQPFVIGTTDGDFLYGIEFFWDLSDAQFEADALNKTYDLPPEGAYQVIELHQEYYVEVLDFEHHDAGGRLLASWIAADNTIGDFDTQLEVGDIFTVRCRHMIKREFDALGDFEGY